VTRPSVQRNRTRVVGGFVRDWFSCLILMVVLVPVLAAQPWHTYLNEPPIRSDALGYHLWIRAILDDNFDFCRFHIDTGTVVQFKRPTPTDPNHVRCGDQYPPGLALLQLPVMAPLADHGANPRIANQDENEAALWMGGAALLLTCVLVVAVARRLRIPPWPTHVALVTMVFGTASFVFGTYDGGFTHVYLALGVAALVWAATRTLQQGRSGSSAIVAFLAACFITAMRNVDILPVMLLVAAYAAVVLVREQRRWSKQTKRLALDLAPVVAGVLLASAGQIVLNHHFSGTWTLSSYGEHRFTWGQQMQRSVLVSYTRGLFTYWPIMAVVLVAGFAVRKARAWTLLFAALVALMTTIYGFWPDWALGGGAGFGHRGFIEIVPVGMIAFAMALSSLRRPLQLFAGGLAVMCACLTFQLALQMWNRDFPEYAPTAHQYWSHIIGRDALWRQWLT
jgi:nitrate reductase NapE component